MDGRTKVQTTASQNYFSTNNKLIHCVHDLQLSLLWLC